MDGLQDDFNNIVITTQSLIVAKNVPLMLFRQLITSLCVNQKQNIPFFTTQMISEIGEFSFDDIFLFLTRNEVWDFLNFHVLTKIVKQFLAQEEEIQSAIRSYHPKVDTFKKNTFLQDYVHVRSSGTSPIPGCKDVMVKVKRKYERFTLADVSDQEKFLASQFLLNQFIFRLKYAEMGCVQITWLIPETAIDLLMPENLARKGEALKHWGVTEIRVNNRYVYKVSSHQSKFNLLTTIIISHKVLTDVHFNSISSTHVRLYMQDLLLGIHMSGHAFAMQNTLHGRTLHTCTHVQAVPFVHTCV